MEIFETMIQAVWEKAAIDQRFDPSMVRRDQLGVFIGREQYGDREAALGWEIDLIIPTSDGGGTEIWNLRPISWIHKAGRQAEVVIAPEHLLTPPAGSTSTSPLEPQEPLAVGTASGQASTWMLPGI